MDTVWVTLPHQAVRIPDGALQSGDLSTPPPFDYDQNAAGPVALDIAEQLPDEFFRLKDATVRGDLDLVKSIFESRDFQYSHGATRQ